VRLQRPAASDFLAAVYSDLGEDGMQILVKSHVTPWASKDHDRFLNRSSFREMDKFRIERANSERTDMFRLQNLDVITEQSFVFARLIMC
jgi:hypothetical protein